MLLLVVALLPCASCGMQFNLYYSTASGVDDFKSLGGISIEKSLDGNFTGRFQPSVVRDMLREELEEAEKNDYYYRVRVGDESIQGFNEPRNMLLADMDHQFRLFFDAERQLINSIAVFPEISSIRDKNKGDRRMSKEIKGSVIIYTVTELPQPDTLAYTQKLEKERQARHGTQYDNRSFIQKYWIYIVAAIIFMVLSNAAAAEQSGES